MEAGLQELVAFHLSGRKPAAGLESIDGLDLRPALLAGYRDLSQLRYDYPLVLVRNASPDRTCVQSLSGIVDDVIHRIAVDEDGDRLTHHVLRLEQRIRAAVTAGAGGSLAALWDEASARLAESGDELLNDSLKRARAALKTDGRIIDCDRATPAQVLRHSWAAVQEAKTRRMREDIGKLVQKLSDILRADFARSRSGRSAESLMAAVGAVHVDTFDFDAMSRILSKSSTDTGLSAGRRRRIEQLLEVLQSQRFFGGSHGSNSNGAPAYSFQFDDCTGALEAYRERLPQAIELARAIAIAELEIDAQYSEARHDALFDDFGVHGLDDQDLGRFPDYLICVNESRLHGDEYDRLIEIFSAGLPMKVLVQTDDILEEPAIGGDAHLNFGQRTRQLTNMAIGLNEVFVLQVSGSHLFQFRERVLKGLACSGPALFSVFSGAGESGLPPYLTAAAAMESRAFPAFTYDPSAGGNWAARFHIGANPQADLDWPVQRFAWEDETHQRIESEVAFTLIDFVACDRRYARHFALIDRADWNDGMISVEEFLGLDAKGMPEKVPCILMVDRDNVLRKAAVDEKLIRATLRCRDAWHSLQELGGIHNSHAERLLERERKAWEDSRQIELAAAPQADILAVETAAPTTTAEPEPETSSDDPWIETARCTTCNECTQINNRMFAYNENKQAYIADPGAGTYRELVLAAESCQLAIIHPGKPRNPNEPGLEEWVARAAPFL